MGTNKISYYVVVGDNGGIIDNNYLQARVCTKYMRGHVYTRKFPDFSDAQEYLLNHLDDIAPWGCPIPKTCRLNKMITIRKLLTEEGEENHEG